MTTVNKVYVGAVVMLAVGLLGGFGWSEYRIGKLEAAVNEAKMSAEKSEQVSAEAEKKSSEYRAKTEYLERQFAGIKVIARKQDEKLEKQNTNTRNARADVERAKRSNGKQIGANELCEKLAELGHPC